MTVLFEHATPDARVLVFSPRRLRPTVQRALDYELEDVLCGIDRVDLVAPERPNAAPERLQRVVARAIRRLPALHRLRPRGRFLGRKDYDLLFVVCQDPSDLYLLGPLAAWQERCRHAVCWIDEVWAHWPAERTGEMELLSRFDLVAVGCRGSVEALREATGTRILYTPPAVDTLRFCPYPDPPERCIDVFNMGRRSPRTHEALLRLADERGWFYFYDTAKGLRFQDHREHRRHLADLIQRSRYFVANRAKVNAVHDTRGQQEVGFRFFEGAAAGAVMIGDPPDTDTFRALFDWDGAVTTLRFGADDVAGVIDALAADPEREARIRRDNITHSLRRHDFAYRWEAILRAVGLAPDPRLGERKARLRGLAAEVGGLLAEVR